MVAAGNLTHIPMNGDKEIRICIVGKLGFLNHRLIDISGSGIVHIISAAGENFAHCHGKTERIITFTAAIIDSTGITESIMSGIDHNFCCHRMHKPFQAFL